MVPGRPGPRPTFKTPQSIETKTKHVSGVDFVIYGARKARDPARVVDGVKVCRQNHQFSKRMFEESTDSEVTSSDFVPKLTFYAMGILYKNHVFQIPADGAPERRPGSFWRGVF